MTTMHDKLVELGIDHVWDDYGAGVHDWPYWARALAQTLPELMRIDGRGSRPNREDQSHDDGA